MVNLLKRLSIKRYICIVLLIALFVLEVNYIFYGIWNDFFSWITIAIFVFSEDYK